MITKQIKSYISLFFTYFHILIKQLPAKNSVTVSAKRETFLVNILNIGT